jgi:hypothetical protein
MAYVLCMKQLIAKGLLVSALCGASLQFSGCVAVVAGGAAVAAAGGTAYVMGDLKVTVIDVSASQLRSAISAAGGDLGLRAISGGGDELTGEYLFRNADDEKITVKYQARESGLTDLRIRVGTFGDEYMSQLVNQAIQRHL